MASRIKPKSKTISVPDQHTKLLMKDYIENKRALLRNQSKNLKFKTEPADNSAFSPARSCIKIMEKQKSEIFTPLANAPLKTSKRVFAMKNKSDQTLKKTTSVKVFPTKYKRTDVLSHYNQKQIPTEEINLYDTEESKPKHRTLEKNHSNSLILSKSKIFNTEGPLSLENMQTPKHKKNYLSHRDSMSGIMCYEAPSSNSILATKPNQNNFNAFKNVEKRPIHYKKKAPMY